METQNLFGKLIRSLRLETLAERPVPRCLSDKRETCFFPSYRAGHTSPLPENGVAVVVSSAPMVQSDAIGYLRSSGQDVYWYQDLDQALVFASSSRPRPCMLVVDLDSTGHDIEKNVELLLLSRALVRIPTICISGSFRADDHSTVRSAICDASLRSPYNMARFEAASLWAVLNDGESKSRISETRSLSLA